MNIRRCPGVYEPSDDSYLLLNIKEIRGKLLEIGCGTGIVGLRYAASGVEVVMTDESKEAVRCARNNCLENGLNAKVIQADMFSGLKGKYDYVIFNPPYLPSDPPEDPSWTGGKVGNEKIIRFLEGFPDFGNSAFYIESSFAPIPSHFFMGLKFTLIGKMEYEFEELRLIKVERDGID